MQKALIHNIFKALVFGSFPKMVKLLYHFIVQYNFILFLNWNALIARLNMCNTAQKFQQPFRKCVSIHKMGIESVKLVPLSIQTDRWNKFEWGYFSVSAKEKICIFVIWGGPKRMQRFWPVNSTTCLMKNIDFCCVGLNVLFLYSNLTPSSSSMDKAFWF